MFRLYETKFYVLDEESAREFDERRKDQEKCFENLLPGSNAYLLDEAHFNPLVDDIDSEGAESGCLLRFDQAMTKAQRERMLSGFIAEGYAVSAYPDHLLLVPWHRSIADLISQDAHRIFAEGVLTTVEQNGHASTLAPVVGEGQLFRLASQILEVYHNRNLYAFLQQIWCSDLRQIGAVALHSAEAMGDEKVSGISVWNWQGQLLLPDFSLPFWEAELRYLGDLGGCNSDEERLSVINEHLFRQCVFKDMELPHPKGESPFFQHKTRLGDVSIEYPPVYQKQPYTEAQSDVLELAGNLSYQPSVRFDRRYMVVLRLLLEEVCGIDDCENAQVLADWREVVRGSDGRITHRSNIILYRDGADWAEEENGHYEGIGLLFCREDIDQETMPYTTVYRVHIPASGWQDMLLTSCAHLLDTMKQGREDLLDAIHAYLKAIINDQTAWKLLPNLLCEDEVEEEE